MSAIRGGVTLALVMAVAGCGKDDRTVREELRESRAELAQAMARKLAFEAYPRWSLRSSNQGGCPTTGELAEYVAQKPDFTDPWGEPYLIRCGADLPAGARGIAVSSKGADRRAGTADDPRSWD